MAGIDVITLALAKKYTRESLLGGGAVVGKNVVIQSITPIDGGNRVTFGYTLDDGTPKTSYMDVMDGKDGKDGEKGATEEQAQQIQDNTDAIEQLQEDVKELQDSGGGGGGSGGTTDYEKLTNKPSINGTELIGDMTLEDIGIKEESKNIDFSEFFS